jgi:hypothetical protein
MKIFAWIVAALTAMGTAMIIAAILIAHLAHLALGMPALEGVEQFLLFLIPSRE